jgi:hypothetical protein
MTVVPFALPGRFYKGNLHTHSTLSDGRLSPPAVVEAYQARGYDFIALTDHFIAPFDFPIADTREFRTSGFTTLLGAELHAPMTEGGDFWHLLAVGLPLDFAAPTASESGPELAARAASAGAFVGIAHPAWYTLTLADALTITAAHSLEAYNTNCARCNDRGDSWHLYEMLLARGCHLTAYACDDAHFDPELDDAFGGWVHVRATELTPPALLMALLAGNFYSSQGPEIHDIQLEVNGIAVACSPCSTVLVTGQGSYAVVRHGTEITSCTLPVSPRDAKSHLRVTVIDAAGKRAWSNPIWLA